jgi:hypothetical protein
MGDGDTRDAATNDGYVDVDAVLSELRKISLCREAVPQGGRRFHGSPATARLVPNQDACRRGSGAEITEEFRHN